MWVASPQLAVAAADRAVSQPTGHSEALTRPGTPMPGSDGHFLPPQMVAHHNNVIIIHSQEPFLVSRPWEY